MKKIAFMIAFAVAVALGILLFMTVATLSLPSLSDLVCTGIACIILVCYSLYTGWHEDIWECLVEDNKK